MTMTAKTPYVNFATVVKTQGLNGEVVVKPTTGLPFILLEGANVFFTPPSLCDVNEARVLSVSENSAGAIVLFEGVSSIDDASRLVGRTILARRCDIPEDAVRPLDLSGRQVVCVDHGPLGAIVDVFSTPANDVWIVEGPFGQVLIPVIESVCLDIPQETTQPIIVKLLRGLIDAEADEIPDGWEEDDDFDERDAL